MSLPVRRSSEQDYEPYDYRYRYDEVGNFTKNHEYSGGQLHYKDGRLDLFNGDGKEAIDGAAEAGNWTYDANGNATHTPRHQELAYTPDNQIRYADMGGDTEVRYFRHGDQRVLKFVRKNGVKALGVYLGPWEYHERTGVNARAKVVLHVGGHGRHAQAEVVLDGADSESLPWFFVHGDHLGSGHILTKADGSLLSQEEYFPYGRASDRRDIRNRYRFIGVEQDEETGLCMTGPRTYDPVTGRFLQGDPIGDGGSTPFQYAGQNPISFTDGSGYAEMPADTTPIDTDPRKWVDDPSSPSISPLSESDRYTSRPVSPLEQKVTASADMPPTALDVQVHLEMEREQRVRVLHEGGGRTWSESAVDTATDWGRELAAAAIDTVLPVAEAARAKLMEVQRWMSADEAQATKDAKGLVPRPGHESQPKWVFDPRADVTRDQRTGRLGGDVRTHRVSFYIDKSVEWLREASAELKSNEPGAYSIRADKLAEFNQSVRRLEVRTRQQTQQQRRGR